MNGASFVKWIHLRRFPVRIAKSVALLLLQRKDAFRAGEHPISRGEPKINKPYDKTKLCKTLIMFRMPILMCRGRCGLMEDVSQRRECLTLVCVAVVSECIFFLSVELFDDNGFDKTLVYGIKIPTLILSRQR